MSLPWEDYMYDAHFFNQVSWIIGEWWLCDSDEMLNKWLKYKNIRSLAVNCKYVQEVQAASTSHFNW